MAASPLAAALLGGGGDTSSLAATFLEPTLAQATPNLQLAQAMLQSGLSSAPASPAQAIGRMAQAISGAYLQRKTLGSLAQMYAGTADNLASVFPQGTPVGDMLRSPDPTVRMMGIQQAGKAAILGQQPYTLSPGQERHQGTAAPVAANTQPRSPLAIESQDVTNAQRGAISGIESGGNYAATGPVTRTGDRAYGKYQVMGANVGPWTKEVLGQAMTPQQFLADPQAQDAVFNAKFGQYAQKYGPEGAARAWFAGESGMNNPNARDQNGTTVQGYANKFDAAMAGQGQPAMPGAAAPATKVPATSAPTNPLQPAIDVEAQKAAATKGAETTAEANAKYYDSLHRGLAGSAMIAAQQ